MTAHEVLDYLSTRISNAPEIREMQEFVAHLAQAVVRLEQENARLRADVSAAGVRTRTP